MTQNTTLIALAVNTTTRLKPSIEALSSSSLRLLDLVLPPLLLLLSLVLRILYDDARPKRIGAHLYRAKTAHARYLPSPASHRFSYPVLFLGLDLDELEHPQRPLDQGRWFRYDSNLWSCMAIRPRVYLEPPNTGGNATEHGQLIDDHTPIKTKLLRHLNKRGIPDDLVHNVYTVTMPAFLGMQDINPLTIHYVYSLPNSMLAIGEPRPERQLNVVVLEVSNTFGEKHLYVLQCGVDEDERVSSGFDHQWTFPRAFHVSPFNDRTGHYRVSLSDPLAGSNSATPSSSPFLPSCSHLNLKIVFLTPKFEKKLFADLSGPGEPLQPCSILSALLKWPLTLLLTTPRILYQAMLLHFRHRLDVFPRPDPFVPSLSGKTQQVALVNPVEKGAIPANVQWQEETLFETRCRGKVLEFLDRRIAEMNASEKRSIQIVIRPGDTTRPIMTIPDDRRLSPPTNSAKKVIVDYVSNQFWADLYASPSIQLALELGSKTEGRWSTDNDDLFLEAFKPLLSHPSKASRSTRWIQSLRTKQMDWSRSFAPTQTIPHGTSTTGSFHPLDETSSFSDLRTLCAYFFFVRLGHWLFVVFRARFVKGTEPWEEWARWERKFRSGAEWDGDEVVDKGLDGPGSVFRS
ncbi:BQ2448_2974 [Microbotryum intermedium]|uniref:BQ2448_2974 protein n=1 Tax=Microbotryum intermedium TaxID=269621 RepID=A0A238FJY2_9BASI|nr:BQ2448_2974 [Microbotryum intermedium]